MLKAICQWIIQQNKTSDLKNFMANLVADIYTDNVLGRGNK